MKKRMVIFGGGTFSHVRPHLSLSAPAFGSTARYINKLAKKMFDMDITLLLTKMADPASFIVTNEDVRRYVDDIITDNTVKVVIFNVALCDFVGSVDEAPETRLKSSKNYTMDLVGVQEKMIGLIRKYRKDIFVVGFKTTYNAEPDEQYRQALNLLKKCSLNLVLANDIGNRRNMLVTPEEGVYEGEREELLQDMLAMVAYRSQLSFTRSTVVSGIPVPWEDQRVPSNLRTIVNWLVEQGAYRVFNGATTGHFACKLGPGEFLTSIRKTNFNHIHENGMVRVTTDGDDNVIADGARPSVGGQSQRIIFQAYPELGCIVHFHCPLKDEPRDDINVQSQFEYECGSHECGTNTKDGLKQHGNLYAVMLHNHGPNIVFGKDVNPQEVIDFIAANFDLSKPTSGFTKAYLPLGAAQ